MPDLTNTVRWVEYAPDLMGNREDERPFYFRLNGSISKAQLAALQEVVGRRSALTPPPEDADEKALAEYNEASRVEMVKRYADALEPFVKLGEEPLTVDGRRIESLHAYLELVTTQLVGLDAFFEPWRALTEANTLSVRGSFSSGRLSGGFTSTASRSSGRGNQTAARRVG